MIKLTTFTVIPAPARSTGTNVGRNTLSSILTGGRACRWKTVKKLYRQLNNEQSLAWQKRSRLGKKEQRILWNNSCSWRKMFVAKDVRGFRGSPLPTNLRREITCPRTGNIFTSHKYWPARIRMVPQYELCMPS